MVDIKFGRIAAVFFLCVLFVSLLCSLFYDPGNVDLVTILLDTPAQHKKSAYKHFTGHSFLWIPLTFYVDIVRENTSQICTNCLESCYN